MTFRYVTAVVTIPAASGGTPGMNSYTCPSAGGTEYSEPGYVVSAGWSTDPLTKVRVYNSQPNGTDFDGRPKGWSVGFVNHETTSQDVAVHFIIALV